MTQRFKATLEFYFDAHDQRTAEWWVKLARERMADVAKQVTGILLDDGGRLTAPYALQQNANPYDVRPANPVESAAAETWPPKRHEPEP